MTDFRYISEDDVKFIQEQRPPKENIELEICYQLKRMVDVLENGIGIKR